MNISPIPELNLCCSRKDPAAVSSLKMSARHHSAKKSGYLGPINRDAATVNYILEPVNRPRLNHHRFHENFKQSHGNFHEADNRRHFHGAYVQNHHDLIDPNDVHYQAYLRRISSQPKRSGGSFLPSRITNQYKIDAYALGQNVSSPFHAHNVRHITAPVTAQGAPPFAQQNFQSYRSEIVDKKERPLGSGLTKNAFVTCVCGDRIQFSLNVENNKKDTKSQCPICFERLRKDFEELVESYIDQGFIPCRCRGRISVSELAAEYWEAEGLRCVCEDPSRMVHTCGKTGMLERRYVPKSLAADFARRREEERRQQELEDCGCSQCSDESQYTGFEAKDGYYGDSRKKTHFGKSSKSAENKAPKPSKNAAIFEDDKNTETKTDPTDAQEPQPASEKKNKDTNSQVKESGESDNGKSDDESAASHSDAEISKGKKSTGARKKPHSGKSPNHAVNKASKPSKNEAKIENDNNTETKTDPTDTQEQPQPASLKKNKDTNLQMNESGESDNGKSDEESSAPHSDVEESKEKKRTSSSDNDDNGDHDDRKYKRSKGFRKSDSSRESIGAGADEDGRRGTWTHSEDSADDYPRDSRRSVRCRSRHSEAYLTDSRDVCGHHCRRRGEGGDRYSSSQSGESGRYRRDDRMHEGGRYMSSSRSDASGAYTGSSRDGERFGPSPRESRGNGRPVAAKRPADSATFEGRNGCGACRDGVEYPEHFRSGQRPHDPEGRSRGSEMCPGPSRHGEDPWSARTRGSNGENTKRRDRSTGSDDYPRACSRGRSGRCGRYYEDKYEDKLSDEPPRHGNRLREERSRTSDEHGSRSGQRRGVEKGCVCKGRRSNGGSQRPYGGDNYKQKGVYGGEPDLWDRDWDWDRRRERRSGAGHRKSKRPYEDDPERSGSTCGALDDPSMAGKRMERCPKTNRLVLGNPNGDRKKHAGLASECPYGGRKRHGGLASEDPYGDCKRHRGLASEDPYGGHKRHGGLASEDPYGDRKRHGGLASEEPHGEHKKHGGLASEDPYGDRKRHGGWASKDPYGDRKRHGELASEEPHGDHKKRGTAVTVVEPAKENKEPKTGTQATKEKPTKGIVDKPKEEKKEVISSKTVINKKEENKPKEGEEGDNKKLEDKKKPEDKKKRDPNQPKKKRRVKAINSAGSHFNTYWVG